MSVLCFCFVLLFDLDKLVQLILSISYIGVLFVVLSTYCLLSDGMDCA